MCTKCSQYFQFWSCELVSSLFMPSLIKFFSLSRFSISPRALKFFASFFYKGRKLLDCFFACLIVPHMYLSNLLLGKLVRTWWITFKKLAWLLNKTGIHSIQGETIWRKRLSVEKCPLLNKHKKKRWPLNALKTFPMPQNVMFPSYL